MGCAAVDELGAVGVPAGDVEQVDAGEDYEEAGEQGEGVDGVGGVEAAVEDEGGAEGGGCEGYVVEGVNSIFRSAFLIAWIWEWRLGGGNVHGCWELA